MYYLIVESLPYEGITAHPSSREFSRDCGFESDAAEVLVYGPYDDNGPERVWINDEIKYYKVLDTGALVG